MDRAPGNARRTIRCAIYTRKSSEEGLDQEFNSLDAQFEACAAYIASQKAEGWKLLPERYDDGGISGGTLERPAIRRLMADIDGGRVDMIVVYKIDRLTRSLADFSRLIDRLDAADCSFVSVTQAFNTSTSMGRLTLNVLLSFAQFEREVTSERIRDKIAASKKKGMWMGGMVPTGYDVDPDPNARGLIVNAGEAGNVRTLFALYDKHECLSTVASKAEAQGIRSKHRTFASGKQYGGAVLSHGAVHKILTNPIYVGRIRHKLEVYDGQHEAIIAEDLWVRVQDKLQAHAARPRVRDPVTKALKQPDQKSTLAGKLFDETGDRLTPSHSRRNTESGHKRIRYYVSRRLMKGAADDPSGWRLPALKLERAVCGAVASHLDEVGEKLFCDPDPIAIYRAQDALGRVRARLDARDGETLRVVTQTVRVSPNRLRIDLNRVGWRRHWTLPQRARGGSARHQDRVRAAPARRGDQDHHRPVRACPGPNLDQCHREGPPMAHRSPARRLPGRHRPALWLDRQSHSPARPSGLSVARHHRGDPGRAPAARTDLAAPSHPPHSTRLDAQARCWGFLVGHFPVRTNKLPCFPALQGTPIPCYLRQGVAAQPAEFTRLNPARSQH
ncbi:MAG: recombinase family protein [Oceanicaulis sp.]|nr:recombinase family protein [Oceanicaulis sp.]